MDNSKRESAEGASLAAEFLGKSTEDAINEAMEDSFEPFLEDCVEGAVSPRNGNCERSVFTNVESIAVRVPRDRLSLFEERILGRYRRRIDDFDAEAERYNRSERNRRIFGFFDLTPGELEMLGMQR